MRPQARKLPLYQALARMIEWDPPSGQFLDQRYAEIKRLVSKLPSGAGWDLGTTFEGGTVKVMQGLRTCTNIVVFGQFHHMDENGFYDGWTKHTIIVRPSLSRGFDLWIKGQDRNDIKDYLHEMFDAALRQEVWEYGQDEEDERKEKEPLRISEIPADYPVRPLRSDENPLGKTTCGTCGLAWNDRIVTSMTPAPSARCPFEAFHRKVSNG